MADSVIPAVLVFVPGAASLLVRPLGRRSERIRDGFAVATTAATFLGALALAPGVARYHEIGFSVPLLLGELTFAVDSFGLLFAIFTSFVWAASTLYATAYMRHESKRDRYHAFGLAALAANMGVVLAGDLVTLYLFFEALGLLAFMLVVHAETDEARAAGVKYLWMTIVGGFALIAGILLVFAMGSGGALSPIPARAGGSELLRWSAAGLMLLGFGVKAGVLPVHTWLPDAHPVAPSPASALLSGIMIKAGAYGVFRVVTALFRPEVAEHVEESLWGFTTQLGFLVIWVGIATMFVGVVLALLQENAKRMLAYHSVSQMGFIITGIGCAGYLAAHGAMGYAGGLFHAANHAVFKACLFLGVGAVYYRTRELNMYKLGGLWSKMPLTFAFTLVAALGISGMPLFNGFVSKCLVHHALVESLELAATHGFRMQAFSLKIAEMVYIVTCGGTVCSFVKLIGFTFLGRPKGDLSGIREVPARMLVAMGALAALVITLGLYPGVLLRGIILPGLESWGMHGQTLEHLRLFTGESLASVAYSASLGAIFFVVGTRTGAFHARFPWWMSIDSWYRLGAGGLRTGVAAVSTTYEEYLVHVSSLLFRARGEAVRVTRGTLRKWRRLVTTLSTGAPLLRHQRFVDSAFVLLEREKHETVRLAMGVAVDRLRRREDLDDVARTGTLDSVRDIATYMATRLFNVRMGAVSEFVRVGRIEPVGIALERALGDVRSSRDSVADAALRYAEPRSRGENVTRPVSHLMNEIVGRERFDVRMRAAVPAWRDAATISGRSAEEQAAGARETATLESFGDSGLTMSERLGRWISDLPRAAAEFVLRERRPWLVDLRPDEEGVAEVRLAVQRYVRDIALNIAVLLLVFVTFALAVLLGEH